MRNAHYRNWNMAIKLTKKKNEEKHLVGTRIWRETLKSMKNNKCTQWDLEYCEKIEKRGK